MRVESVDKKREINKSMGSCSSTPEESSRSPNDNLDVKTSDTDRALSKAVNYQFKLALIGDSTYRHLM